MHFCLLGRIASVRYAVSGLRVLVQQEQNARIHLTASILVGVVAIVLGVTPADGRWLVLSVALVWSAEAFNTAIEILCDHLCPQQDPRVAAVKDLAAGAVLVAALAALAIGLATFFPYLRE